MLARNLQIAFSFYTHGIITCLGNGKLSVTPYSQLSILQRPNKIYGFNSVMEIRLRSAIEFRKTLEIYTSYLWLHIFYIGLAYFQSKLLTIIMFTTVQYDCHFYNVVIQWQTRSFLPFQFEVIAYHPRLKVRIKYTHSLITVHDEIIDFLCPFSCLQALRTQHPDPVKILHNLLPLRAYLVKVNLDKLGFIQCEMNIFFEDDECHKNERLI